MKERAVIADVGGLAGLIRDHMRELGERDACLSATAKRRPSAAAADHWRLFSHQKLSSARPEGPIFMDRGLSSWVRTSPQDGRRRAAVEFCDGGDVGGIQTRRRRLFIKLLHDPGRRQLDIGRTAD
ncbi:MAG: hypothetical protein WCE78_12115, partial [Pseudonocardiaceae bacterium]